MHFFEREYLPSVNPFTVVVVSVQRGGGVAAVFVDI